MRKAQNIVEISLLAGAIAVIAIAAFMVYNNQKMRLADMSRFGIISQSVDLMTLTPERGDDVIPYGGDIVVDDALLRLLAGERSILDKEYFKSSVANITYQDLKNNQDFLAQINNLIRTLGLDYDSIDVNNINSNTLPTIVGALNDAAINSSDSRLTAIVNQFGSLLNLTCDSETTGVCGAPANFGGGRTLPQLGDDDVDADISGHLDLEDGPQP